jgi:uncharacterized protein with NAD-binding domain and iron-sulfur cluster
MRIAILGGGVGAMTAAYWLSGGPEPNKEHDITVYQLGWRLGGKGASGRNLEEASRIEEHGLHVWMGCYANAFRMMRAVYGELGRPPGTPLATWEDAFKPQSVITMMQPTADGKGWVLPEWMMAFPLHPGKPGDQVSFHTPCAYITAILESAMQRLEKLLIGRQDDCGADHDHHEQFKLLHGALIEAHGLAGPRHDPGQAGPPEKHHLGHHLALRLALEGAQAVIGLAFDIPDLCLGTERALLMLDMAVAVALGILRDLCGKKWESIDGLEWREWMRQNGMHERTLWSTPVRTMYDLVFAYINGERGAENANLAAGTTTEAAIRVLYDYYEALFMKMQSGMGDTIFGPLYLVLKKRGVKFEFFHRLREVVPSADGRTIDELRIGVQATTYGGAEYDPLVDVKGLPSWPSEPIYQQLQQGEELKARHIDLENYDAPWPDVGELVLRHGTDFDLAVFGLSAGAVPYVCKKLVDQKKSWQDMVSYVKTVRTQAFQLWLSRNIADLGWPPALNGTCRGERAMLGTFVEPLDSWADMSQLIPREDWQVPMKNIAYFCGVLDETAKSETEALEQVVRGAHEYLSGPDIRTIWTYSCAGEGTFHFHWLCVNEPGRPISDEERFRRQFFRANTQPTERYVLSVAGSTEYRLDPANPGYDNLCLAGDWVRNGFAIGCVESAVLGGMKGVQPHCPNMWIVETRYE